MKRAFITSLVLVSTCAAVASAADLEGSATLGGSYANIKGQQAKLNEYRTLGAGLQGAVDLDYRSKDLYTSMKGSALFIDHNYGTEDSNRDLNFELKVGSTDSFKASLFYNEIPHNYTFGASTYLTGVGTETLTKPTATTNPTLADYTKKFDYAIKRSTIGAEGEISLKSPFFFSVKVDRTTTNGLYPFAVGTSLREVPAPIDYVTNNIYLQTGYRSDRVIFTVDGLISNFANEFDKFSTS